MAIFTLCGKEWGHSCLLVVGVRLREGGSEDKVGMVGNIMPVGVRPSC